MVDFYLCDLLGDDEDAVGHACVLCACCGDDCASSCSCGDESVLCYGCDLWVAADPCGVSGGVSFALYGECELEGVSCCEGLGVVLVDLESGYVWDVYGDGVVYGGVEVAFDADCGGSSGDCGCEALVGDADDGFVAGAPGEGFVECSDALDGCGVLLGFADLEGLGVGLVDCEA